MTKKCDPNHLVKYKMELEVPKEFHEYLGKSTTRLVCQECHDTKAWYSQFALAERIIEKNEFG